MYVNLRSQMTYVNRRPLRGNPESRGSASTPNPWGPWSLVSPPSGLRVIDFRHPNQYERGSPNTFSPMKFRIMCAVTGAMRMIRASRR